jgi:hypothetical protein
MLLAYSDPPYGESRDFNNLTPSSPETKEKTACHTDRNYPYVVSLEGSASHPWQAPDPPAGQRLNPEDVPAAPAAPPA